MMRAIRLRGLRVAAVAAVTAILGVVALGPGLPAQAAATYSPIVGQGSSYAYPALQQWSTDMESQGLSISYTPNGSEAGRLAYISNQVDYAGSDIAFLTKGDADPFAGVDIDHTSFAYSYIPDVAGGLSFPYNLTVAGKKITNMRLSGQTLTSIFTGKITNWDDARITHDYGQQLPRIPITVVTRSDGAGESYFLTNWMLKEYKSTWVSYCEAQRGGSLCNTTPTEFYPHAQAGFKALDGATNVTGYIHSPVNDGAIGYVEYAYAIQSGTPVVSMANTAGYYVQPTASNVAIALEKAQINENPGSVDFLMQNLADVYSNPDPRAYPLSSYSYLIVPRDSRAGTTGPLEKDPNKGKTLSTYVNYILCQAQQTAAQLGYSPLPQPMVIGGFTQDAHIPGAVSSPAAHNYAGCNNPAYENGRDVLTATAPQPNACQEITAPLNCTVQNGKPVSTGVGSSGHPGSTTPGSHSSGPGGSAPGGSSPGGNAASGPGAVPGASASVDPNTGQVVGSTGSEGVASNVFAQPVGLTSSPAEQWMFGVLTALELLAVVAVPAALGTWLTRNRRRARGATGPGGGVG